MSNFILKPIFWNTAGYKRPSGVVANSGYPKKTGFGHEEWNNSEAMSFVEDGVKYRAFHTEGVGNLTLEEGTNVIFMYASHDGIQELVGMAGNATCLIGDEPSRKSLVKKMKLEGLGEQAWSLTSVRSRFVNKSAFDEAWSAGLNWIPNWICPDDMFCWLEEPIALDPHKITGKSRFVPRFSTYTLLSPEQAQAVMAHFATKNRSTMWYRIEAAIEYPLPDLEVDIRNILKRTDIPKTTRSALVDARRGQGKFRSDLERRWESRCAVTECAVREVLRASHTKPWKASSDLERLDSRNGLLLAAHIDALFDRGLISFKNSGEMLVSELIPVSERKRLGLPKALSKTPNKHECDYLAYHRKSFGFTV